MQITRQQRSRGERHVPGATAPGAPELPGPVAPEPPPAPERPAEPGPAVPVGFRVPAGLELGTGLAAAEAAELRAVGPWGTLPVPFALAWLSGAVTVFTTFHADTYRHLRKARAVTLSGDEWSNLTLAVQDDRLYGDVRLWIERKARNPLYELNTQLVLQLPTADPFTTKHTIRYIGERCGFGLLGLVWGPCGT